MQFLIFAFTVAASALAAADLPKDLSVKNGCVLKTSPKTPRLYPGNFCLFLDDGSIISADPGLRRILKDQSVLWEIKGHFHHQITLSPDKKRVLALSSDVVERNGVKERDDSFLIVDVTAGKVLHRLSGQELRLMTKNGPLNWYMVDPGSGATIETSHFNSIYEIGENRGKAPYLAPGNIIINGLYQGTFILSPDLRKVLYHSVFKVSSKHRVHDVQVSSDGTFLFFNNFVSDPEVDYPYSAIQKLDPVTGKITFTFHATPKAMFFSPTAGGVQELNEDLIFFSHQINGGYVYSRKARTVTEIVWPHINYWRVYPSQELKLVDVTKFLQNQL